jgi:hypothetical protein
MKGEKRGTADEPRYMALIDGIDKYSSAMQNTVSQNVTKSSAN